MKKNCKLFVAVLVLCLVALVLASCGEPDCSEGHTWGEGVVTTEAGCTDKGTRTFTCSVCGETKAEDIAPAHTVVVDAAVPATCTATGKTEGKHCSVCNTVIEAQKDVEKLAHTEVVDAAVPATCAAVGKTEGSHCSVCNTVMIAQKEIPALAHTFVDGVVVQPTCTEEGRTAASRCSVCGYVEGGDPIPAEGHTFVTISAVEASCTAPGRTAGRYCSVCAYKELGKPTIMLPHLPMTIRAKAPTCSSVGYSENGVICEDCGEWIKEPMEIPIEPENHTTIVDMDDAPATCAGPATTGGKKCADCGAIIENPTPHGIPLPHEFEAAEALAPTCAEPGHIAGNRCKNCGAWEDTTAGAWIAKLPHTYDLTLDAPATGKTLALIGGVKCSVCGDIKEEPKVDPDSIYLPYVDLDFTFGEGSKSIVDKRGNVSAELFGATVRKFDELKHGKKVAQNLDALYIGSSGDYARCTFTNIKTSAQMRTFAQAGFAVEAFYVMGKKGGNTQGVICATQDGGWGIAENTSGQPYFITGKTSSGGYYNASVTAKYPSSSQALVHVVAVYDFAAKTQKLYINGVLDAEKPIQADFKIGAMQAFKSFCLGSDTVTSGFGGDFPTSNMTMVDAKIYEIAFDADMAKKIYDKATEGFVSTVDPSVPQGPETLPEAYADLELDSTTGTISEKNDQQGTTSALVSTPTGSVSVVKETIRHDGKVKEIDVLKIPNNSYVLCELAKIAGKTNVTEFVNAGFSLEVFYKTKTAKLQGIACAATGSAPKAGGWGLAQRSDNGYTGAYFTVGNGTDTWSSAKSNKNGPMTEYAHVVAVFGTDPMDDSRMAIRISVNGEPVASSIFSGEFNPLVINGIDVSNKFFLGANFDGRTQDASINSSYQTDGLDIADLKVYNVALSDEQIALAYEAAIEGFAEPTSSDDDPPAATLPEAYADLELDSVTGTISEKDDQQGTTSSLVSTPTGSVSVAKETIKHNGKIKEIDVLKIPSDGYVLCELAKIAGKNNVAEFVNAGFSLEIFYKTKTAKIQGIACAATGNANVDAGGFGIAQNNGVYFCMGDGKGWPKVTANNTKANGPMSEYAHLVAVFGPDPADPSGMAIRLSVNGGASASTVFSREFYPLVLGSTDLSNKFLLGSNYKSDGTGVNATYQTDGLDIVDLKIYDVALSDAQIALAYEAATEGFTDPEPYADFNFSVGVSFDAPQDSKGKISAVSTYSGDDVMGVANVTFNGVTKEKDVLYLDAKGEYVICEFAEFANNPASGVTGGREKMQAFLDAGFTLEVLYQTKSKSKQGIVCCACGNMTGWGLAQNDNGESYYIMGNGSSFKSSNPDASPIIATASGMSELAHVVVTYDGKNQSVYVNGKCEETTENVGSIKPVVNDSAGNEYFNKFVIGANFEGKTTGGINATWESDGLIVAGLRIYDLALNGEQVASLYDQACDTF